MQSEFCLQGALQGDPQAPNVQYSHVPGVPSQSELVVQLWWQVRPWGVDWQVPSEQNLQSVFKHWESSLHLLLHPAPHSLLMQDLQKAEGGQSSSTTHAPKQGALAAEQIPFTHAWQEGPAHWLELAHF
jgi:hypothetical protein